MKVSTRVDDIDKHESDVSYLLYHKGKLYSAGNDGRIKMWSADLTFSAQVKGHNGAIYGLTASDDTLYSCSNDGTIKAWELNTLKEKSTIYSAADLEIWCLSYADNCLYAGDNVGYVRIFKHDQFYGEFNIAEPIKDMLVRGTTLYTVRDLDITITEMKLSSDHVQYCSKATMIGKSPVTLIDDRFFAVLSRDGKDIIIHETNGHTHFKEVTEIKGAHEMIINAMRGVNWNNENVIFSAGWDQVIKKWKLKDELAKQDGSCPVGIVVNAMAIGDKGFIYVGGSDGHIVRVDA